MLNKNILISGAGIAGLTLAFWLKRFGFEPVVIERHPKLREGGYMIDFFGLGVEVAEKMGTLAEVRNAEVDINELVFVNEHNKRVGGFNVLKFKKMLNGRAFNLLRSNISAIIYEHVRTDINIRFGVSVETIDHGDQQVQVTFSDDTRENFDLVIGADGLHSNIRNIVFGAEDKFEKWYGYYTSSFTIENFLDAKTFYSYTKSGKQASMYALKDNKLAAFFVFRSGTRLSFDHRDTEVQKDILRREYRDMGWYCPDLLQRMDSSPDFYFDTVSQIKMNEWSNGRVSLVGDACDCPSLLSGQGAALAMVGAYVLAGELKAANGNHVAGYARYQEIMRPFIDTKQQLAEKFADSFVPRNKFNIWLRNTFTNLMFIPLVSKWFVNKFLKDNLVLKGY